MSKKYLLAAALLTAAFATPALAQGQQPPLATIKVDGTTLELSYLGLNHSDSNIVMRLPKEKIVFIVDTIPVGQVPGRGFIDMFPLEAEDFIKKVIAMDWDRLIPGHPGVGGRL